MEIYHPREDSHLIEKSVRKYAKGRVLDIGTGTGILAEAAVSNADSVLGVDVNPMCIEYCKKHVRNEKIAFCKSNLFSDVNGDFDTIIFNPPYLPDDEETQDIALDGGEKGWEIIESFLRDAKKHLACNGRILLLFSSFTDRDKINEILLENSYKYKQIDSLKMDFERLYVYMIENEN